jgi:hypothetical protein
MCQNLAGAKQFSFEANEFSDEVMPTGQKLQFTKRATVSIRRPNNLHAVVKGDRENFSAVYDGKMVAFHDPTNNQYATAPMPDTIDAAVDTLATKYGMVAPLVDLLFSDPKESLTAHVQAGMYIGEGDGGCEGKPVPCHHLAFRQDSVDWQIWVDKGEKALPRKLVITYKTLPGEPQFVAFLGNWNLSPNFAADLFKFNPAPGAKQIELKPLPPAPTTQPGR